MTRILFWNIEQFGINKIRNPSRAIGNNTGGLTLYQAANQRRALLRRVIVATEPDIIVIIEVSSGDNRPNRELATSTGGMQALVYLQNYLNTLGVLFPGGWNQVPPLQVGLGARAEAVGVLYRRQNNNGAVLRYFTGPNTWGGGNGPSVDPRIINFSQPYGNNGQVNFDAMLMPPGLGAVRNIPAGALHNPRLPENQVAARVQQFTDAQNRRINYGGYREPYMVTFTETDNAGTVQRNLTLFCIHTSPQGNIPAHYVDGLANTQEIVEPLGANETRVVGGDFNLNLLLLNGAPSGAYNALTNNNYTLLVAPTAAGAAANVEQYKGYFSTHIRYPQLTAPSRFLWSDPGGGQPPRPQQDSFYPGYGYVGSNFVPVGTPFYAIDNILVWPFQGPPYNYQTTIMNLVTGTPFNAVAAADNPPQGIVNMPSAFGIFNPPPNWPPAPPAAAPNYPGIGGARNLTSWANYGRIRSTSDHFAVFANV
ncbi:MAG: hypothetical protein F6J92_03420 [Symploca sp. SIO1A3]|nr:hypothetical protein [Symploca sp. SIO1A3]